MVYLGPRLSEAYSLKWQDVNFDKGWVAITGTKTTKANRMVPLPPVILELLKKHRQREGSVLAPWNNIRRDLELSCKKAGITRVTPNDLRRTFASWLKQAGVDSFTVAKLMGHTSSRMVELVYGHLNDIAYVNAVKVLPALPMPPKPGSQWVADASSFPETSETHETSSTDSTQRNDNFSVPRAGIEPATRGFSVPAGEWATPRVSRQIGDQNRESGSRMGPTQPTVRASAGVTTPRKRLRIP